MKAGTYGLILFAVGSVLLLVFSPLYSPDLALVPPGPVNSPTFTLLYYVPRIVLSGVLLSASVLIIFTEDFSKQDKYWAYGMIGAVLVTCFGSEVDHLARPCRSGSVPLAQHFA